jgi:hypothetical protein
LKKYLNTTTQILITMNRIIFLSKNIKYNNSVNRFIANDNKKKMSVSKNLNYNKIISRKYSQQFNNDPKDPFWKYVIIMTTLGIYSQYLNYKK